MSTHLEFKGASDLESVRAKLKRFNENKILMRCHYAEPLYSAIDLSESEHYSNQTGTVKEEEDKSFTLGGELCSFRNIDRDIAEMQPHDNEGKPFYKKYVSVQIITTD